MKMTYWLNSNRGFIVCVGTYDCALWCLDRNLQSLPRHLWCLPTQTYGAYIETYSDYTDTYGAYIEPIETPMVPTYLYLWCLLRLLYRIHRHLEGPIRYLLGLFRHLQYYHYPHAPSCTYYYPSPYASSYKIISTRTTNINSKTITSIAATKSKPSSSQNTNL